MTTFSYRGRDSKGQLISGNMESHSSDGVLNYLLRMGITPVAIEGQKVVGSLLDNWKKILLREEAVSRAEIVLLTRQMYSVIHAGVPLVRGMRSIANSGNNPYLKKILLEVVDNLESGIDLTSSLRKYPQVFNHLYVSIVHVGESSGSLDRAFDQLASYLEKDLDTYKRIKSAMRYPTFVVVAMAIAITVINIMVIPSFADLFARFETQLPLPTRILMGVSGFFVHYWWLMLLVLAGTCYGFLNYIKTEAGKIIWGRYKLKTPVVGDLVARASMARYTRSLSLMMRAGVPLIQSLELCANAVDNAWLGQQIRDISQGVARGEALYQTHHQSGLFTPLVLQMIAVGEESGNLTDLLLEVAGFYEREVDYDLKTLSDRLEPLLIIMMAGLVLVLALGIFLPIWEMKNLHH